jgi:hypothetical protein
LDEEVPTQTAGGVECNCYCTGNKDLVLLPSCQAEVMELKGELASFRYLAIAWINRSPAATLDRSCALEQVLNPVL